MSREDDFVNRMAGDVTLMATLTGGVYAAGGIGPLGIHRETVPGAFDANGYLRPVALVRQRGLTPDGVIRDGQDQVVSASQVVEVYFYEDVGYSAIDAAAARVIDLFEGFAFPGTFPVEWIGVIDRVRDNGALSGASLKRLDFAVFEIV